MTVSLTHFFTFSLVFSLCDALSASPLCWLSYSMCALLYTALFSTSWLQSVSICSFLTLVSYSTLPYSLLLFTLVILFITNIVAVALSSVDLYFIYISVTSVDLNLHFVFTSQKMHATYDHYSLLTLLFSALSLPLSITPTHYWVLVSSLLTLPLLLPHLRHYTWAHRWQSMQ